MPLRREIQTAGTETKKVCLQISVCVNGMGKHGAKDDFSETLVNVCCDMTAIRTRKYSGTEVIWTGTL